MGDGHAEREKVMRRVEYFIVWEGKYRRIKKGTVRVNCYVQHSQVIIKGKAHTVVPSDKRITF